MSVLQSFEVLSLNSQWLPIAYINAQTAFTRMSGRPGDVAPATAIDFEIVDGRIVNPRPVKWDEWQKLEPRQGEKFILTSRGPIRIPSVVVAQTYGKISTRKKKLGSKSIWERDGGKCQITGKQLTKETGNMGHIKARALGGKFTWDNIVLMDAALNRSMGTLTPEEAGYTLLKEPKAPAEVPAEVLISNDAKPIHRPFFASGA